MVSRSPVRVMATWRMTKLSVTTQVSEFPEMLADRGPQSQSVGTQSPKYSNVPALGVEDMMMARSDPWPSFCLQSPTNGPIGKSVNVAATGVLPVTVIEQVGAVPEHAPVQPAKLLSSFGATWSSTAVGCG